MSATRTIVKTCHQLGAALDPPVKSRQVSEYLSRGMPREPDGGYCVEDCQEWADDNIRQPSGNHSMRRPTLRNDADWWNRYAGMNEFEVHKEEYRQGMSGFSTGWNGFVMPAIRRILKALEDQLDTAARKEIVSALEDASQGMRKAWGGDEYPESEADTKAEYRTLHQWARGKPASKPAVKTK